MGTMNSGLGGSAGFGETVYSSATRAAGNLDDGSVQVDIMPAFGADGINFFGTTYAEIYVNSNGLITFEGPETSCSPSGDSNEFIELSTGTDTYFGGTDSGECDWLRGRVIGEAIKVDLSAATASATGGSAPFKGIAHVKGGPFDDFKTKCIGLSRHVNFSGDRSMSTVVSGA